MSIVFDRLAESRICPLCGDLLRLYVTEAGIQLLACMSCSFDVADQTYSKESVLNRVRQMAVRDRREHSQQKRRVIKESDV